VLPSPGGLGAQQSVADALFQDWKAGDRQAAAQVATDAVVGRLFGMAWDSADTATGCTQTPASTVICSYAYPDGTLQFYVDGDAGSYRVDVLGTQPY